MENEFPRRGIFPPNGMRTNFCGYRKGYSTQTVFLMSMLEKWKLPIDNESFAGGVVIN